jgi:ketosteroid isomerase-like protein
LGARGPHDDFEAAKAVVEAGIAALARGDFEAMRELTAADGEHVTRDGLFLGPERLISEFAPQLERWSMSFYLEELVDAGDGALIAMMEVERRDRETGEVELRAWPATVIRVQGGRIVFLEGYVDRRKALTALGLER